MATSHLKGGQIQQQGQKEKRGKKEGETRDVQAGHKASDAVLFHWDWIRSNTFHTALHPTAPVSKFLFCSDVLQVCKHLLKT